MNVEMFYNFENCCGIICRCRIMCVIGGGGGGVFGVGSLFFSLSLSLSKLNFHSGCRVCGHYGCS